MPFLPFVLLLVCQALSRSASFALGWATAIHVGQVPGRQRRILSVISLLAAGWVILVIGFAVPKWNVLYRLRLQLEQAAEERRANIETGLPSRSIGRCGGCGGSAWSCWSSSSR